VATLLFVLWAFFAAQLLPLALVFFPATLAIVLLVPLLLIGLPLLLIRSVKAFVDKRIQGQQQGTAPANENGLSLLLLKVTAAQVFGTIIAMTWFIGYYTQQNTWSGYMSEIMDKLSISFGFFDFLSFDFDFAFSWPNMDWEFRLPLAISAGTLVLQYGVLLFKWLDRKKFFDQGVDENEAVDQKKKRKRDENEEVRFHELERKRLGKEQMSEDELEKHATLGECDPCYQRTAREERRFRTLSAVDLDGSLGTVVCTVVCIAKCIEYCSVYCVLCTVDCSVYCSVLSAVNSMFRCNVYSTVYCVSCLVCSMQCVVRSA
jgi:hypothetical protein